MEILVEEIINDKAKELNIIVDLVVNTIKAKALYKRGGWDLVHKELGNRYMNPNFSMHYGTIYQLLDELKIKVDLSIKSELFTIERMVNQQVGITAVKYCVDRKAHFLKITI